MDALVVGEELGLAVMEEFGLGDRGIDRDRVVLGVTDGAASQLLRPRRW